MPTDHSLPCLRRSDFPAGRRRFDPGRPLSRKRRLLATCQGAGWEGASQSQPRGWRV